MSTATDPIDRRIADDRQLYLPAFKFIDLFAGIGGTRLAFERAGGKCVFSSEWDKFAALTYEANFGETPAGDIREIDADAVADFDVLVAGFPCQPFSIAGVSKHTALGVEHGFKHPTQGTLFFEIVRLLRNKRPKAFLLENVKNLKSHDKGRTFQVILSALRDDLGYNVFHRVIDAKGTVPQHRERTYIVGFRESVDFQFPEIEESGPALGEILVTHPPEKYRLTPHLWNYLQEYALKHRSKGNGFGFGLVNPDDPNVVTRTLSARYYKDGSEILIETGAETPRRLTPRECARLMGFPDDFRIPVSDTQAYKQFGNSVVVPVVETLARSIAKSLA